MNSQKGTYQLLIRLAQPETVRVGRLGLFDLPEGYYVYTGSAMNGLRSRISRHLRKRKRLRWHIDYLLARSEVIGVYENWCDRRLECELNELMLNSMYSSVLIHGFGSSDCRCRAHLVYLGKEEECAVSTFLSSRFSLM